MKSNFSQNTTTNNLDRICMIYVQSSKIFYDMLKYEVIPRSIYVIVSKPIFKKNYCPTCDVLFRQFFISKEMTLKCYISYIDEWIWSNYSFKVVSEALKGFIEGLSSLQIFNSQ